MASSLNNSAWVNWITALMGGVSRQTVAATFPPDRFYCLLDELPLHLISRPFRKSLRTNLADSGTLYLNPQCTFCRPGELPDEVLDRELLSGFALQGTIAWVRDWSGAWLPFWLGTEFESLVRPLRAQDEVPTSVPVHTRRMLAAAGIFVSRQQLETLSRDLPAGNEAHQFQQRGYAPLGNLIHPFHIAALRRYYRHLIRQGAIQLGDGQSHRRYVAHNEAVARFFHHLITAKVSAVAGQAVKPSYVYLASYLSGAELKKHTDREQCEFSVTLCLDFSPEPALATPWPIQLDAPNGTVTVYQAIGDGLAYRGTQLPHYRAALGEGRTSTSIFFHYVAADFRGSLT